MQLYCVYVYCRKVVNHSIVHRAMLDFFQNCDNVSRAVSHQYIHMHPPLVTHTQARTHLLQEMIELMREVVVSILHTKEGSRVALHCLWHGTPKVLSCIVLSL